MKWHQTPADVSKVSMNMPFLLLEVLLWYPQSQEKCPLVFWLCISSFQGWIHSCWRRLWTHVLGTPTPSHSELPPCPGWGDTNTHQQVQQWQLPPNFSIGGNNIFFPGAAECEHFPFTPEPNVTVSSYGAWQTFQRRLGLQYTNREHK